MRDVIVRGMDGRIKMNRPYPDTTNISSLAKLFFKTFISLKHLSDCLIIATAPLYTYKPELQCILIGNINRVTTCYTLDIAFLTCGNDNLTYEQNCIIFKYVFDYIKCSKRFLIV